MKNALILHGTFDDSQSNWFPWLKKELEKKGYRVWVPDLPYADKPNIYRYNQFIFKNWEFDKDSMMIGHSSGAVAILGILENLPENVVVKKAVLVAGFVDDLSWEPLNELFLKEFNWEKIKRSCEDFVFIHSDNDPYVDLRHGEFLEEKLGGKLVILKNQKHFSVDSFGKEYKRFSEILMFISRKPRL